MELLKALDTVTDFMKEQITDMKEDGSAKQEEIETYEAALEKVEEIEAPILETNFDQIAKIAKNAVDGIMEETSEPFDGDDLKLFLFIFIPELAERMGESDQLPFLSH